MLNSFNQLCFIVFTDDDETSVVASNLETTMDNFSTDDDNNFQLASVPEIKVVPYRIPLKDPDDTPPKLKRQFRSRSLDQTYFPRVETVTESELELSIDDAEAVTCVQPGPLDEQILTPVSTYNEINDYRKLRPSLRCMEAYS